MTIGRSFQSDYLWLKSPGSNNEVGDHVRRFIKDNRGSLTLPFGDDVARAAEGRAIGRAGDVAGIDVGRLTPSKKVLDYDYAYFNRPYNSSNLLIGEIISTGPPGRVQGGVPVCGGRSRVPSTARRGPSRC